MPDEKPTTSDTPAARQRTPDAPDQGEAPAATAVVAEDGATSGAGASTNGPASATSTAPEKPVEAAPVDDRQQWYCVDPYGPKTQCTPFRSNAHLTPDGHIECPNCGGKSAMRAEIFEVNHPETPPRDIRAPAAI